MGQVPPGFKPHPGLTLFGNETALTAESKTAPNGVDFWWDEAAVNTGNCWYDNEGPDGTRESLTADPPIGPRREIDARVPAGGVRHQQGQRRTATRPRRPILLACYGQWEIDSIDASSCSWWDTPPKPDSAAASSQRRRGGAADAEPGAARLGRCACGRHLVRPARLSGARRRLPSPPRCFCSPRLAAAARTTATTAAGRNGQPDGVVDVSGTESGRADGGRVGCRARHLQDWKGANEEERLATIDDIRGQLGAQDSGIKLPELTDEEAEEVFDNSCRPELGQGFRLYKLYAQAAGFVTLKRELEEAGDR